MSDPKILFYDLASGVTACSIERGAVNPADPYDGFNACHYVNDTPAHVAECRQWFTDSLGPAALVIPRQTHSLNVAVVTDTAASLDNTDALVTNIPGISLCINTADCIPLLMADSKAGVIAAVHSGWRGTVGQIAARALQKMLDLGATPANIKAVTGPSICPECFEVGTEVAHRFDPSCIVTGHAKPHIDLRKAIAQTLIDNGVPPASIDITTAPCSRCNPHRWCSARAQGINSARTLSAIWIHSTLNSSILPNL